MSDDKEIHIVVVGEAGNGKSTLCNTLIGKNDIFKESSEPECETKITSGQYGIFDKFKTFIIDTPGVGDPEHSDSEHLTKMIQYVKKNPKVSVIILVFNGITPRFTSNERRILELFYSMAPGTPIHRHLAVVWTRCLQSILNIFKIDTNNRKKKFYEFIKKYLPQIPNDEIKSIPQYFIDSVEARKKDSDHHKDLGALLAWAQNTEPIQKIGVPFPKILEKVDIPIFILPNGKREIDFIGNIGLLDKEKEYNLIPNELPIDTELIIKREIHENSENRNNFIFILTTINSNKQKTTKRFQMKKKEFAKAFAKENNNNYYPLYYYTINAPSHSKYYICKSLKPKITFIPFSEDYSIILPDYSQLITPKFIHVNWEEDKEGKVYEIAHQQLSFLGIEVVIPETVRNGPFDLEWEHNHKSKYSFCYIKYGAEKKLYKSIEYKILEEGKTYTEGLWSQTHIKEPDKYRLGDGTIYITDKIVSKDRMPLRPTAPFTCEIWVDGTKTNGWNKGKPFEYRHHNKGDQIERYRTYGKGWSLKRIDYMSWGDSAKYRNAVGYNGPNSGTLLLIW